MVDVPPTAAVGSSAEKADLSQDDWRKTNKHDAAKAERDKPGAPYAALGRVLAITLVMAVAAATLILGNFTSLTFWIRIGLGTNSSVDERVHRILSDTPLIGKT